MGNGTDPAYGCRLSVLYRRRKYFRGKGGLEQSAQCVPGIVSGSSFIVQGSFFLSCIKYWRWSDIYNFSYYGCLVLVDFDRLSSAECEDVGLYDGGKYCLSGSSSYNFVPVAEKPGIYSCGKRDDSADVSFRRTYDLSVVASDYVCKLYAISLSDIFGIDRYFEQKKSGLLNRRNLSDDYDKLLFQHRWNTGAWSIWNLPVCKDKRAGRRDDYGKRISR